MPRMASSRELDEVVARVAAAREVLGDTGDVGVDVHGRMTPADVRRLLPLLEPFRPMFVEEPVTPENSHLLSRLVDSTSIPIATGERLFSRQEFLPILQSGVAIIQPDLSHAGGISETRKIASMAEVFDVHVAPHCPLGPIALAASLQLGFATPNHLIQEHSIGIHYNEDGEVLDYVVDPSVFDYSTGSVERMTGPGLGIEVDERAVRDADTRGHAWRGPVWRHADGSFAEW
jgi:galactonate dehydratase